MLFGASNNSPTNDVAGSASSAASNSLPPLPDDTGSPKQGGGPTDPFQAVFMQIAPVKAASDQIMAAARTLAQLGITSLSQTIDQIVALTSSLVPAASQSLLQPGAGGMTPMPGVMPDMGSGGGAPGGGGGAGGGSPAGGAAGGPPMGA